MDRPIVSARKVAAQIFCLEFSQPEDLKWFELLLTMTVQAVISKSVVSSKRVKLSRKRRKKMVYLLSGRSTIVRNCLNWIHWKVGGLTFLLFFSTYLHSSNLACSLGLTLPQTDFEWLEKRYQISLKQALDGPVKGGFHRHLLVFPFVHHFNSRIGVWNEIGGHG